MHSSMFYDNYGTTYISSQNLQAKREKKPWAYPQKTPIQWCVTRPKPLNIVVAKQK
jgi:hypothetical protein